MLQTYCRLASVCLFMMVGALGATEPEPPKIGRALPNGKETANPIYKSSYRIINVHTHAPFPSEATVRAELDVLDRVGVTAFNVLLVETSGWPQYQQIGGWSEPNLLAWLDLRKRFPDRVLVFGTVDFRRVVKERTFFADIVSELERNVHLGMQGVKIWKNLGMHLRDADGKLLRIDDPRLGLFWKKCGELGVPVLIHTADPKEYWYPKSYNTFHYGVQWDTAKYYQHAEVPKWEELIAQRNNVLKKHPQTKFIGAHFASLSDDFDEMAKTLDDYPNLSVECGARLHHMYRYHPQAIRDFFVKYQDRILFGTDGSLIAEPKHLDDAKELRKWQDNRTRFYSQHLEYFETDRLGLIVPYGDKWMRLTGVKLPPEVLEKFYHANAERLIPGLQVPANPKPSKK